MRNDSHSITQLFHSRDAAEKAYLYALQCGYADKDINIIMSDEAHKQYSSAMIHHYEKVHTAEDLMRGGATGATVGGVLGAIFAVGTHLVVPGIGIVIAGPLTGAGAIAGGLVGTLLGLGLSKEHAEEYEEEIKAGGIVLSVQEKAGCPELKERWKQFNEEKQ